MDWFATIQKFYNQQIDGQRLWGIDKVADAVAKGKITADQYKEITGEDYTA